MKLGGIGPLELGLILLVVLIIFGPKNLPKLGSAIGKGVKNLREGIGSAKEESEQAENEVVGEVVEETPAPAPAPKPIEEAPAAESAPKKKVVKKVVKKEVKETE